MQRHELEHLIRAAGAITGSNCLVIVGSQAILGSAPDAPAELLASMEADMWPEDDPSKAELIEGSIGELSPFHGTFGYYAHGVAPETATLPSGWRGRVVRICNENTRGVAGLCLHPVDVAISKLVAGRAKDLDFVRAMVRANMVARDALERACGELERPAADRVRAIIPRL
jgi:hypothetical protein